MEIRKNTLVVTRQKNLKRIAQGIAPRVEIVISGHLGIVKEIVSDGPPFVVKTTGEDVKCYEIELIPLAPDCRKFDTPGEALRAQLPDVIVNLVHIIVDLRDQIKELKNRPSALPYTIPKK